GKGIVMHQEPGQALASTTRGDAWEREVITATESTRPRQMAKILGYFKGMHATHLINLGNQLGLFDRLAAEPGGTQPDVLATALGLHAPYVRQWCETACALELLDYDPVAGYRLAPFMDEILGRSDA